jgi:hypothetical protein
MGLYNRSCAIEMCEILAWRKYKWSNLLKIAAAVDLFIWLGKQIFTLVIVLETQWTMCGTVNYNTS